MHGYFTLSRWPAGPHRGRAGAYSRKLIYVGGESLTGNAHALRGWDRLASKPANGEDGTTLGRVTRHYIAGGFDGLTAGGGGGFEVHAMRAERRGKRAG